jgi:PTH1 family peptidyl-tRNA hydrolase
MKLVFAIGNPGEQYKKTRHSIGLLFSEYYRSNFKPIKFKTTSKYEVFFYSNFILLESKVYMNLSRESLFEVWNFYKIEAKNLIVIHDEIEQKEFAISLKQGGQARGHNGLRSIISLVGPEFARLRIGIDHPKKIGLPIPVDEYVLSRLPNLETWEKKFENAIILLNDWINDTDS